MPDVSANRKKPGRTTTFPVILALFHAMMYLPSCHPPHPVPHLQKTGHTTQLVVDGKPFIILGGETGNSSATTPAYMNTIWPTIRAMNLNTVLVPVYWELVEPEEGTFDFSLVRQIIAEARKNKVRIIFLWFASWKNSMSCYAPAWIKLNPDRFPRVKDEKDRSHEILTPFSENNLQADLRAFEELMRVIRDFDGKRHTVIMIQVENEIGMLPSARDYHPLANEAFKQDVPAGLIQYMMAHRDKLAPEFRDLWAKNGYKARGNWEEVFGTGLHTDEIFMAWHYAKYVDTIAKAGKKMYPLPMYVNAALNRPGREPGSDYPSGGPLPHLMDVWKAAAPSIDFLAPDIYFSNFKYWCDLYTRQGDPLFIPEHRFDHTAGSKSLYAVAHYRALGFAPFSIESAVNPENEPLGKIYRLMSQITPLITSCQATGTVEGALLDREQCDTIIHMGGYTFTLRHDYTLGWSPGAEAASWPHAGAILMQTADDEFLIAGTGIVAEVQPRHDGSLNAGILTAEEGWFENDRWRIIRHLNGDQTHQGRHVRIPAGENMIQKFTLYTYK